ncbi:MAG: hypothetical protein KDK78_11735 [Chlamydiia bacterium]|nr:hypothetical protein [Chlamydiia bacterium]
MMRRKRLLLNAEAFGFGTTAAIADFFPSLRGEFEHIAFAGSGHTLDLQRGLAYDAVYDLGQDCSLSDLLGGYDVFLTAMDFAYAEEAIQAGLDTIVYDPLLWYWRERPALLDAPVLYLAQDFYSVRERFPGARAALEYVPPLIHRVKRNGDASLVLVNFGGIQNPFWPDQICVAYAERLITVLKEVLEGEEICILSSSYLSQSLQHLGVQTLARAELCALLPSVKFAIQSSGLANIYDSAAYDVPTLFLPPANDSQGQQLDLLRAHGHLDLFLDWSAFGQDWCIDYRLGQAEVMEAIGKRVRDLAKHPDLLEKMLSDRIDALRTLKGSQTRALLRRFGVNGTERVCEAVLRFVDDPSYKEQLCLSSIGNLN